jgi:hypothetical protein
MIHAGVSPASVAAAVGHTSGETIWKHYARTFDGARGAKPVPMDQAIWAARRSVGRTVDAWGELVELFPDRSADEMSANQRHFRARAAGFEPATFGSGGQLCREIAGSRGNTHYRISRPFTGCEFPPVPAVSHAGVPEVCPRVAHVERPATISHATVRSR